jgi:2-polyprenyl-3-methyl-5-hydroxy-6-metoxy-1,4-benzoquinol methylase
MKERIWKVLVALAALIPNYIHIQLCRILFEAGSRGNAAQASKNLLTLDNDLHWYINVAAMRYGEGVHPKHRLTKYHDFFTTHLSEGERVLDVGCGYGALAESMGRVGAVVFGIDIDKKNIEQAKERYNDPRLTFLVGDIRDIDLPEDVDTVVMSNVLEHIENRRELLSLLKEKVAPGRFLIRVPLLTRDWMVYFRKELDLPYFCVPTHFTEYTLDSFYHEMGQSGLAVTFYEIKWGELYAEAVPVNSAPDHRTVIGSKLYHTMPG